MGATRAIVFFFSALLRVLSLADPAPRGVLSWPGSGGRGEGGGRGAREPPQLAPTHFLHQLGAAQWPFAP